MMEEHPKLFICKHPLVQSKLSLLRDETTDSKMFRELMKEIGLLLGYEATQDLTVEDKGSGTTGFGSFTKHSIKENVALVPILRGGLGLIDGIDHDLLFSHAKPDSKCGYITFGNFPGQGNQETS
jgi:uracil phosphoribosyltransferase